MHITVRHTTKSDAWPMWMPMPDLQTDMCDFGKNSDILLCDGLTRDLMSGVR